MTLKKSHNLLSHHAVSWMNSAASPSALQQCDINLLRLSHSYNCLQSSCREAGRVFSVVFLRKFLRRIYITFINATQPGVDHTGTMNMYRQSTPEIFHSYSSDDEIDLLELGAVLWRGKHIIIATIVSVMVAVIIGLMLQKPAYQVETIIESTSTYDIQALQPTILSGSSTDDQKNSGRYQVQPLKHEHVNAALILHANSLHAKQLFWESKLSLPSSSDSINSLNSDSEFNEFFHAVKLIPPNPKNPDSTESRLTLETTKPESGTALLNDYADFLNQHVASQFIHQLKKGYDSSLMQLEADYLALQQRERQKLDDELVKLHEALTIAQSLEIVETPYTQLAGIELKVIDDRQYLLGSRVLSEEINSLMERRKSPLSALVPELRHMEYWKEIMENDVKRLDSVKQKIHIFERASPAVSSLDPIGPNKLLILLAAFICAGIIGVVLVLMLQGIRSYRLRTQRVVA